MELVWKAIAAMIHNKGSLNKDQEDEEEQGWYECKINMSEKENISSLFTDEIQIIQNKYVFQCLDRVILGGSGTATGPVLELK